PPPPLLFSSPTPAPPLAPPPFPTRRSSDLRDLRRAPALDLGEVRPRRGTRAGAASPAAGRARGPRRSGEIKGRKEARLDAAAPQIGRDTSELQSPYDLVCRLLLEKKKKNKK